MPLDPAPSARKIGVALRQGEDRVQMIREDHDGFDREGTFVSGRAEGRAQGADVIYEGP
jgi:hypothetical protein